MWSVIVAIALTANTSSSVALQASAVSAAATVSKVEVCLSDETTGVATISLDVAYTNRSAEAVVGTWEFVPGEIFAARSEEDGRANRWLWSFGSHSILLDDLKAERLEPGKTKHVSRDIGIPISPEGIQEIGFLPAGSEYYFVLRFEDDMARRSQRPARVAFFALLPSATAPCKQ